MITWPQSLIEELSARRCIVFIGSGASAGCVRNGNEHPPSWSDLLASLLARTNTASADDKSEATRLMGESRYLDAAEVMRAGIYDADYSTFISHTFRDYQVTDLHKHLNDIDPKVVITTNFDKVYEQYCQKGEGASGYVVHRYYDEGLVARLRSPQRLIVKVHGCMDVPEKTVLTKSEFFKARQLHPNFFKTLESLFLTHTLLFIGYSLSDPDIQLLLENTTIAARSAHPHYAVMPKGIHPSIRSSFRKTYNIETLEYDSRDGHVELVEGLEVLKDSVLESRAGNPDI